MVTLCANSCRIPPLKLRDTVSGRETRGLDEVTSVVQGRHPDWLDGRKGMHCRTTGRSPSSEGRTETWEAIRTPGSPCAPFPGPLCPLRQPALFLSCLYVSENTARNGGPIATQVCLLSSATLTESECSGQVRCSALIQSALDSSLGQMWLLQAVM